MLGIYCRISREKEEGKDRSIEDQMLTGVELAKRLNIEYRIYKDEGESGTLPIEKRPDLNRMIDDIYSGDISKVFAIDQARLERNPEVRSVLKRIFKDYDIDFYTTRGLEGDDPESELMGNIVSSFNYYYTRQTARRIKGVQKRLVEQGKALAINPFGYKTDEKGYLVIDEDNRKLVEEIFEMSLKGNGAVTIARHLNELGAKKNHYDTKWIGNNVLKILKNPIYKGERIRNGVKYEVEPILDAGYWQKVNDNLQNNKVNRGARATHFYLLKNVAKCGRCGGNFVGHVNNANRTNNYRCTTKRAEVEEKCGNRSINRPELDAAVWWLFEEGNLRKKVIKHFSKNKDSKEVKELKKKIKVAQQNINSANRDINTLVDKVLNKVLKDEVVRPTQDKLLAERDLNQKNLDRFEYELKLYDETPEQSEILEDLLYYNEFKKLAGKLYGKSIAEGDKLVDEFNEKFGGKKPIKPNVSDKDKQEIIERYVDRINVYFDDKKHYFVELTYKIPSLEPTVLHIDWKYYVVNDLSATDKASSVVSKKAMSLFISSDREYAVRDNLLDKAGRVAELNRFNKSVKSLA